MKRAGEYEDWVETLHPPSGLGHNTAFFGNKKEKYQPIRSARP